MLKSKWFVVLAIIAILSSVVLAGCGGSKQSGNNTDNNTAQNPLESTPPSSTTELPSDKEVTIRYWQYDYASRVNAINELITKFQEENPNIKVVHETFPYDQYQQKVAAAMQGKDQPEIINMFMGWEPKFIDQGFLQPIPADLMSTAEIEQNFAPMVKDYKFDDQYYALPIAVRTLAFFWNKDIFAENGLDPEKPPQTWDEVLTVAKQLTKYDKTGTLEQSGYGWNVLGQDYHLYTQVLLRQWGGKPFSDDNTKVTMNETQAGYDAFKWWMDMNTVHKVGKEDFLGTYDKSFLAGKTAMITDGSFRLGALKDATFNWGVTELPVKEMGGEKHTYGSFFANGITANVSGDELAASIKFMKFLVSDDSMRFWLENVGEIPASAALANDPALQNDPKFGAFVRGLPYAHATFFADEAGERDAFKLGTDEVIINKADPKKGLDQIVDTIQNIRDEYFSSH